MNCVHPLKALAANDELKDELRDLKKYLKQPVGSTSTPPPRHPAPSPSNHTPPKTTRPEKKAKRAEKERKEKEPNKSEEGKASGSKRDSSPSLPAKLHRLRRLCERKPSGRLNVPEDVHLQWVNGDLSTEMKMLETLENAEWNKDYYSVHC